MRVLIEEHPARLTFEELVLIVRGEPGRDDPGHTTRSAVDALLGAGLLHREGRFLSPTRAAVYLAGLDIS